MHPFRWKLVHGSVHRANAAATQNALYVKDVNPTETCQVTTDTGGALVRGMGACVGALKTIGDAFEIETEISTHHVRWIGTE